MYKKNGFTLIEILIIIAIAIIITVGSISVFVNFNKNKALEISTQNITSLLKEARSLTLASKNANVYGVHLQADKAILFEGSNFSSTSPNNREYNLPSNIKITSINLNGGGNDVLFNRLTGETDQFGTTTTSLLNSSSSKNIIIENTGIVEF